MWFVVWAPPIKNSGYAYALDQWFPNCGTLESFRWYATYFSLLINLPNFQAKTFFSLALVSAIKLAVKCLTFSRRPFLVRWNSWGPLKSCCVWMWPTDRQDCRILLRGAKTSGVWEGYIPPIIWMVVHLSKNWGKKCSIFDEELFSFWLSPEFGEKSVPFAFFLDFTKFLNLNKIVVEVHPPSCWK